ncbi:acyl-CoA dehydrogenase family protein [Marinobacteraceae bacterium S3BR75-40.1]
MAKDPMGMALSAVTRLAGSDWLDRLRVRELSNRAAYTGTRAGFTALGRVQKQFKRISSSISAARLPHKQPGDLFDLTLDDDQQMIVDQLVRFARDTIRPQAGEADEAGAVPEALEQALGELGLSLYAVPESLGGVAQSQDTVTAVLIGEQLGYGDMGVATAALTTFSTAKTLSLWGNGKQQARYLEAFTEEQPVRACLAVDEPRPLFDPFQLRTRARRSGDGYELNGVKSGVAVGEQADLFLVAADVADLGPRLFLVERGTPGLSWKADPGMGCRAAAWGQLALEGVRVEADALLGQESEFDYANFIDRSLLMRCALAVGCAQAVLDYVIPYCNQREAFGEPISHRQAVAFAISDMAIEVDSMRLLLWRAASRADQGLTFGHETRLAYRLCAEKSMEIGSQGVQLLGGHGYVKEHPVERWYRDLRSTATLFGGLQA